MAWLRRCRRWPLAPLVALQHTLTFLDQTICTHDRRVGSLRSCVQMVWLLALIMRK